MDFLSAQDGKLLRVTRSREIPYQRWGALERTAEADAKADALWEEVPDLPASPDPALRR